MKFECEMTMYGESCDGCSRSPLSKRIFEIWADRWAVKPFADGLLLRRLLDLMFRYGDPVNLAFIGPGF